MPILVCYACAILEIKMEKKFTEGNWIVKQNQEFPTLHEIWSGDNKGEIPTFIAKTCYAPRSEANANLISAAPDLLEQLIVAKKLLIEAGYKTWSYRLLEIDKAIKKATTLFF